MREALPAPTRAGAVLQPRMCPEGARVVEVEGSAKIPRIRQRKEAAKRTESAVSRTEARQKPGRARVITGKNTKIFSAARATARDATTCSPPAGDPRCNAFARTPAEGRSDASWSGNRDGDGVTRCGSNRPTRGSPRAYVATRKTLRDRLPIFTSRLLGPMFGASRGRNSHGIGIAPTRSEVRGTPGLLPSAAQETRRLPLRAGTTRSHRGRGARRSFRRACRDRRLQARPRARAPQAGCGPGLALGPSGARRPPSGTIVSARRRGDRLGAGVAPRGDPKPVRIHPRRTGPPIRSDPQLGQPETRPRRRVARFRAPGDPRRPNRSSRGGQVPRPLGARQSGPLRVVGARHLAGSAHEPGNRTSLFRLAGRVFPHPRSHRLRAAALPQGSAGRGPGSRRRPESSPGAAWGRRRAGGRQPPDSPPDSGGRRRLAGPLGDRRSQKRSGLGARPDRHGPSGIPTRRSRCSTTACERRS